MQEFLYPALVVVAAYRAFRKFEYAVRAVLVFEFFVARRVALVGVQKEVIYVKYAAGAQDAEDFRNQPSLFVVCAYEVSTAKSITASTLSSGRSIFSALRFTRKSKCG